MPEINATILIPDISGFTEFMTTTELTHSSRAINFLIDSIVNAVGEEYEVSEIEGDAVLLIKRGPPPSKKEILDICLKIFNSFHFQRKWMEQHTICPCKACQALINLTLKFVVHHGPLAEIKVGRFIKHSGPEMIVAHRLLKNSINNDEYLLMTEKLLQQAADMPESADMEWFSSSEDYSSFGKVGYRFALLNEARKNAPGPPAPPTHYLTDDTLYLDIPISANFFDVYLEMMDIPGRQLWQLGLEKVEQDMPHVFIGSTHHCKFEDFKTIVSPLRMDASDERIVYAESCEIKEMNVSLVHEYVFKNTGENNCIFATRFMNTGASPIPEGFRAALSERLQKMAESLKDHCEKLER